MPQGHNPEATIARSGPLAAIAARYAGALFELALESKGLDLVEREMRALQGAIAGAPPLRAFLASPVHDADTQFRTIAAIADKAGFSALTKNYLSLVAKNRRLFALEAMAAEFLRLAAAHRGEVSASAASAAPLSDEQTRRLRGEIERMVGKAVNLTTTVEPDLLGGLVVKIGSTMIDSSLKTKLNRLKSVMKEARHGA